jgi:hypothetical protein
MITRRIAGERTLRANPKRGQTLSGYEKKTLILAQPPKGLTPFGDRHLVVSR